MKANIPDLNPAAKPYEGREALDAEVARRLVEGGAQPPPATDEQPPEVANALDGIEAAMSAMLAKARRLTPEQARQNRFDTMIAPRMGAIGFPPRYRTNPDAWNCPPQERVFEFCRERFVEVGAIVALVGERGVGKTFIAAQLCRERIEAWLAYHELEPAARPAKIPLSMGRYLKLTDLIALFKPLYADFGSIEIERLMSEREKLCRESLLCLDELHECEDQKLKGRVLTDILDRRYSNRLDTLVISNEKEEAFRQSIGDSALSRITEHGEIVTCTWASHRTPK